MDQLGIAPGVYDGGLLTVFGRTRSHPALMPWRWLLRDEPSALAATALGDLFFWSERQHPGVWFLEVQRGRSTIVGKTASYLFEEFLTQQAVREKVLRAQFVKILCARLGELTYDQCYIAQPWQAIGGSGAAETYTIGDREVYWSLVGQMVKQMFDDSRQSYR